jgi:hypothetical protein
MREGFIQARAIITDSGYTLEEIRDYLDDLRDTGRFEIYGAGDYLINVWGFETHEAKPIVADYLLYGLQPDIDGEYLYGAKLEE